MASTTPTPCPGCGETYPSANAAASHAFQIGGSEHPWESYAEARNAVDSHAAGGEPTDEPDPPDGGDGTGANGGSAASPSADGNPLLSMPAYRDDAQRIVCPECGDEMRPVESGRKFVYRDGREKVDAVTTDGDHICNGCRIISDGDTSYHNVQ